MKYLYYLLFFLTPFLFSSANSELFELPKMYFVYGIALIILIVHLYQYLRGQVALFRHTFFDWPLLIFIVSQIVSTVFSIDVHTSIFGYYSRLNGGLLSLLTYSVLYWVLAAHLDEKFKENIIKFSLFSGFLVAVYGITEHFGIDKNTWVQDVQSRVFSTLGQPNWLAAYLCVLLPFAIDHAINSKSKFSLLVISNWSLVIIFYVCLLFTKSKSGIIAALISVGLYFLFKLFSDFKNKVLFINHKSYFIFLIFIVLSLAINNPLKDYVFPPKVNPSPINNTINITPSENIRKLVWAGSFHLWQQFPLFGTGPETFAYTYYWVRPAAHNLTSEWNFLYNKSHNEYLNYLATTGTFGFLAYLLVIGTILFKIKKFPAVFAAFVSILITNAAGFSVVIISLFFFLLPAFVSSEPPAETDPRKSKLIFIIISVLLILTSSFLLIKNFYYYIADITYDQAINFDDNQQYSAAYNQIQLSLRYRSNEPNYLIKAADLSAKMALISKDQKYISQSLDLMSQATKISPFNLNFWKEKSQIYYYLSTIDSEYYLYALDTLTKATKLAPTDAASFYMLGEFYGRIDAVDQAISNYQTAIALKSNYDYAYFALGKIYLSQKKYALAKSNFEFTLKIAPNNTDTQNYLAFIATQSAGKK